LQDSACGALCEDVLAVDFLPYLAFGHLIVTRFHLLNDNSTCSERVCQGLNVRSLSDDLKNDFRAPTICIGQHDHRGIHSELVCHGPTYIFIAAARGQRQLKFALD
jgi:hypothetical protein